MKIVLTAVVLALVVASTAAAFNDVTSPDGTYVVAVGNGGTLYRSWNGGAFWSTVSLGTANLNGVAMRGLTAIVVGAGGRVWHSADAGGNWVETAPGGAANLLDVYITPDSVACAVGTGGTILRSVDAGATWSARPSGATVALRAVRFRDALNGWAVGDSGTALRTFDGGDTWGPVVIGAAIDLLDVDAAGSTVWVVGRSGAAWRSHDDGASWSRVPLGLDASVDVNVVRLASADTVWLSGGGGFVRRSTDDGATWAFAVQPSLDALAAIHMEPDGLTGWAAARDNALVLSTLDGGLTWTVPIGTTDHSLWDKVQSWSGVTVRGSTLASNGRAQPTLYVAVAAYLYRSRDRGESWTPFHSIPGVTKTNAFYVSPYDSLFMVAAVDVPDRIVRSTDGGATWTTVLARDFSEFGTPLEMDVARPETLLFAPEDGTLYRSLDFGATWDSLSAPGFRSPCDIQIVPDDPENIWVGDGVTGAGLGQVFQSTDGGQTFAVRLTSSQGSEIPALTVAPLDTRVGLATQWALGGVARTLDGGATWTTVSNMQSAWGASFAPDDPMAAMFGQFAGGVMHVSTNQGSGFILYAIEGSNYSIFALDRGTFFTTQSTGIYKFRPSYALPTVTGQFLTVDAPNGGEIWRAGETHEIRWSPFNVFLVEIEYQTDAAAPWLPIATVPGYAGSYDWEVPPVVGSSALVRVRNAWGPTPVDASDGFFTLASPFLDVQPAVVQMGTPVPGQTVTRTVTLQNPGNIALDVTAIDTGRPDFWTGRMSLSIPAGGADTVGVSYRPATTGRDTALISIETNDPQSPHTIVAVGEALPAAYSLSSAVPNPFRGETSIRYALPAAQHVRLEVFNLQGQRVATLVDGVQAAGEYAVPFGPDVGVAGGLGRESLPSGVYFYRLRAGAVELRGRMVMVR